MVTALTWRFIRPGFHVNDETGLELHRGRDEEVGIEWQVWTAGMVKPLGVRPSLIEAKRRAAEITANHPDWLTN